MVMQNMDQVVPDVTRWHDGNVRFVVKRKVKDTEDDWIVLQSVHAGGRNGFRSPPPKEIVLDGDKIREWIRDNQVGKDIVGLNLFGNRGLNKTSKLTMIERSRAKINRPRSFLPVRDEFSALYKFLNSKGKIKTVKA